MKLFKKEFNRTEKLIPNFFNDILLALDKIISNECSKLQDID
jgi:hypothetical protein